MGWVEFITGGLFCSLWAWMVGIELGRRERGREIAELRRESEALKAAIAGTNDVGIGYATVEVGDVEGGKMAFLRLENAFDDLDDSGDFEGFWSPSFAPDLSALDGKRVAVLVRPIGKNLDWLGRLDESATPISM